MNSVSYSSLSVTGFANPHGFVLAVDVSLSQVGSDENCATHCVSRCDRQEMFSEIGADSNDAAVAMILGSPVFIGAYVHLLYNMRRLGN